MKLVRTRMGGSEALALACVKLGDSGPRGSLRDAHRHALSPSALPLAGRARIGEGSPMPGGARTANPLTSSPLGGRLLSASQLPWFTALPPRNYGVLTTTGRKTGKRRRRCVRAVRSGELVYLVAIKGGRTGWVQNALSNPQVGLRIRGGRFEGIAREPREDEIEAARAAYCEAVGWFEYLEFTMWRTGRPRAAAIRQLHREWFEQGVPLVIKLR
jgi:deazaflavin-dependent oxidoreductase (nitroreductase family)